MARPHIDIDFSPFTRAFGFAAGAFAAVGRAIEDGMRQRQHALDVVAHYDFETYAGTGTYMGRYYPMVCKWASESRKKNAHIARYRLNAVLPLDRARTRYGSAPWIFTGRHAEDKYEYTGNTDIPDVDGCEMIRYPVLVKVRDGKPIYRCYDINHRDFASAFYIGRSYSKPFSEYIMLRGAP